MTGVREWVGEPVDDLLDVELALMRGLKDGVFVGTPDADTLPVTLVDRVAVKQRVAAPDVDGDADTAGESVAEPLSETILEAASDADTAPDAVAHAETDADSDPDANADDVGGDAEYVGETLLDRDGESASPRRTWSTSSRACTWRQE
jgi:hypothetical protein